VSRTLLLCGCLACTPNNPDEPAEDPAGDSAGTHFAPAFVAPPSLGVPGPLAPTAYALTAEVQPAASLTVTLSTEDHTLTLPFASVATHHLLPILGLLPSRTYTGWVEADGGERVDLTPFTTADLPEDFPNLTVLTPHPDPMEAGLTLLDVKVPLNSSRTWVLALDAAGRVAWWVDPDGSHGDLHWSSRGTLVGLFDGAVHETSVFGEPVRRWTDEPTQTLDTWIDPWNVHHEWTPLEDGGFLGLTKQITRVDAYPAFYARTDWRVEADVDDPIVFELNPDGSTRYSVPLSQVLDTSRIGFDSLDVLQNGQYDWAHANGVSATRDGAWVVSLRHQDALIKLTQEGELVWILGDPVGWTEPYTDLLLTPEGDGFLWPAHPHAPEVQPDGSVVVFDNGRYRASPYEQVKPKDPATFTRVVAYSVDEARRTVTERWVITPPDNLYSGALGDADVQAQTGNVLMNFGFLDGERGELNAAFGWGRKSIRLLEIHPDRPDEVLWDVRLSSSIKVEEEGWKSYRAERISSLYADGVLRDQSP
jgi:arylsulfate sulfotransferase